MSRISIAEFEKYHARQRVVVPPKATLKEVVISLLVGFVFSPFLFVTASVIPMMGQITMLLVVALTILYLIYRRSLVATAAVLGGALVFTQLTFSTIQSIKYHIEVPMFIFTALGIPVCFLYCMFIATRIWIVRGGEQ